ncbi:MAG: DUF4919 domain-containing protein [Chthoniobacterales bacterium]
MNLRKVFHSLFAMFALCHTALAQNPPGVAVPSYDDKYSKLVRQLEAGETDINYREFRESFLESEQFKVAAETKPDIESLRKTMRELMKKTKYTEIVLVAKKMLSIDYTDMEAHKILQQTYKVLGDAANQKKYHDIEFGLLNSIVKNGDGKTCQTAWPVIQVTEEYFILNMLGARLLNQGIDSSGPCDKMEVRVDEGTKVYYFEISKVFKGYNTRGIH